VMVLSVDGKFRFFFLSFYVLQPVIYFFGGV
jgi:hypothetical protein